jgi:Domain of unknown function (DUF5655)
MVREMEERPLWECPRCGRRFANRNQSHTCAPPRTVEEHLEDRSPEIVATYRAFEAAALRTGDDVVVVPEKTRIAFQVRMSFAAVTLRPRRVDAHVVLARRLESPRFRRVETYSPRNHLHAFQLERPEDVDAEVMAWLGEASRVGRQEHRDGRRRP